jgi:hypothetical protein
LIIAGPLMLMDFATIAKQRRPVDVSAGAQVFVFGSLF